MGVQLFCSPIGRLKIVTDAGKLVAVRFVTDSEAESPDIITLEAVRQLSEYFEGTRRRFDLPVKMGGSEFYQRVWSATQNISYGSTATYGDIARTIGKPTACRAVGTCLHRNDLLIIVPCHRVVAASGIGGFGLGTDKKRILLELEQRK